MLKRSIYISILSKRGIPDDIISVIDNHLLKGLIMFQKKIKQYLSLKRLRHATICCDDCKKYIKFGETLTRTNACADHYGDCCFKYVCSSGYCGFRCPDGHINYVYQHDYYKNTIRCLQCRLEYLPEFTWTGLSPYEYNLRYN